LATVALLIGLLAPAVQRLRESAAAAQCRDNLRQIALATANHVDVERAYPPARIVERPSPEEPAALKAGGQHPSWLVRLLPYLEKGSDFAGWDLCQPFASHPDDVRNRVVPTYLCPSRRGAANALCPLVPGGREIVLPCGCRFAGPGAPGGATGDYAGNHGDLSPGSSGLPSDFQWGGNGTGVIVSSRGLALSDGAFRVYDKVRIRDITDGTSNTFLAGESHVRSGNLNAAPDNHPIYDGSRFYSMSRVAGPGVPLARDAFDDVLGMSLFAFGSWHSGVCQFAFADGRVVAVSTDIATDILERLCNRADGLTVEIP
jgi:prepilin-type processing-associated H-X9-DG protein